MAKRSRTTTTQRDGSDSDSDFPRQRDGWLVPPNKRKVPLRGVEMRPSRIYRPPAIADMDYLDYGFGLESPDGAEEDNGAQGRPPHTNKGDAAGPSGAPDEETELFVMEGGREGDEWVDTRGVWFRRCQ